MIWCPYSDREVELNETTPEHIIPLSLGGCDQLVVPVHGGINATLGTEIDGKITEDFIVKFLRRESYARGHSGKKPEVILRNRPSKDVLRRCNFSAATVCRLSGMPGRPAT